MQNPFTHQKKKRRYRLSAAGLAVLQASAVKHRPWLNCAGPKTAEGKLAIRNNNLRHGYYAKIPLPEAKKFKAFQKAMRRERRKDAGLPVTDDRPIRI